MLILAIHSTSAQLGIAVTRDGTVLEEIIFPPGREHLENLAPAIRQVLNNQRLALGDFDGFSASIGPGSFSGIRIGLATVKGMALALSKPVVGISSLEVLAWQALPEGKSGVCIIDARRSEMYAATYRKDQGELSLLRGPMLIKMDTLSGLADRLDQGSVLVCGDTAIVEAVTRSDPRFVAGAPTYPSPSVLALLAERYFSSGKSQGVHTLTPLYVRRSDAEEKARVQYPRGLPSGC